MGDSAGKKYVHPYIPSSNPEVAAEMLQAIGAKSIDELTAGIPERLRCKSNLDLPPPLLAEEDLRGHVEGLLSKNKTCDEYLNFLGAGCWQHYVPAICDEIGHRAEFVSAYTGDTYADHGKFQSYFEFQSMIGELVEMDLVSFPTYDWATASGFAIRMASRLTGRSEVLVPGNLGKERLSVINNFCQSATSGEGLRVQEVKYDASTGLMDVRDLKSKLSPQTAAVYFENPSYLGFMESQGEDISEAAHRAGSLSIVGADPISLGILKPPSRYGADLVCGEVQPLGLGMNYGGSLAGFIASQDSARFVSEYPMLLVSIAKTAEEGRYGFARCTHERTLYIERERGNDFTGSSVGLWAVVGAVYLALLGPRGIKEVGERIIQKSHYAAKLISEIKGTRIVYSPNFFKEFVVDFEATGKSVSEINKVLLTNRIFGGKDLSDEFPELGQSALYCVTEVHKKEDIDRFAEILERVVS